MSKDNSIVFPKIRVNYKDRMNKEIERRFRIKENMMKG